MEMEMEMKIKVLRFHDSFIKICQSRCKMTHVMYKISFQGILRSKSQFSFSFPFPFPVPFPVPFPFPLFKLFVSVV